MVGCFAVFWRATSECESGGFEIVSYGMKKNGKTGQGEIALREVLSQRTMPPMNRSQKDFRKIPSVDRLLRDFGPSDLPQALIASLARDLTSEARQTGNPPATYDAMLHCLRQQVDALRSSRLQPVINATGIVLHTNLGRAPLSLEAVWLMSEVSAGYCNLEFDLAEGSRSRRGGYVEKCFALLTGSSWAAVVNNCAAALFLILHQFVQEAKPEALVSRGDLVQIGGGFRIPEILSASGAVLREVGTTNRTTLADFKSAITERTGLILRVHRSNFYMEGFVKEPKLAELAELGRRFGIPLVYDQGSGAMADTATISGAGKETTPGQALDCGASLVCFSADKLFGGPQAGLICGSADRIETLKKNPLYRALRPDKLALSALQTTVEAYLRRLSGKQIPEVTVWQRLSATPETLSKRGQKIIEQLCPSRLEIQLEKTFVETGGGALPRSRIPSVALKIGMQGSRPQEMAAQLRRMKPPVIGYVADNRLCLDLRTVFPSQDNVLARHLAALENQSIE